MCVVLTLFLSLVCFKTAAAMCVAKKWRSYFIPSMLSGILGYSMATFISIFMGVGVLKPLAMR